MTSTPAVAIDALEEIRKFVASLLKDNPNVDQPKLAAQLKWYVLGHQHLLDALIEQHLYGICYRFVHSAVSTARLNAWCAAADAAADAAGIGPMPDENGPRGSKRAVGDWFQLRREAVDKAEIGPMPITVAATAPVDEAQAEHEEALLLQYENDRAEREQRRKLERIERWRQSQNEWASYRETVAPHHTKALWTITGLELDAVLVAHRSKLSFEKRTIAFVEKIRSRVGDAEQVGECYEPEEIARLAQEVLEAA